MVDPKKFNEGIDLITANFGENAIRGPKLQRIRQMCEKRISGPGFVEICQTLCDNFRNAPVPNDFEKALQEWRKNYFYAHGHSFGHENFSKNQSPNSPVCAYCLDLGVIMITRHTKDGWHCLMRCDCGNKSEMNLQIPEWDNGLGGAFKKDPCPLSWFKPDLVAGESDQTLSKKIWERVEFFKEQKRGAEAYWMSLGFKT